MSTPSPHLLRATLPLVALLLAAVLGLAAGPADAAITPVVQSGRLAITGDAAADTLALRLAPGAPTKLQLDVGANGTADFTFDRTKFTAIDVAGGGGDDRFQYDGANGSFTDELITVKGGLGADVLTGAQGVDKVLGGDGSDRAEFTRGARDDSGELSYVSPYVRVRHSATVKTDVDDVERIDYRTVGGADTVLVGDLSGSDARTVLVDAGGADASADRVTVKGTANPDTIDVTQTAGTISVDGPAATVLVTGTESARDLVDVQALAGGDRISGSASVKSAREIHVDGGDGGDTATYDGSAAADSVTLVPSGAAGIAATNPIATRLAGDAVEYFVVQGHEGPDFMSASGDVGERAVLVFDGGAGDDRLFGSAAADWMLGEDGNDTVAGGAAADYIQLGAGDDVYAWREGGGRDFVKGEAGTDTLDFRGTDADEFAGVVAVGTRAEFRHDLGTVDLQELESISYKARGGMDFVAVHDLKGSGVTAVDVDVRTASGAGDKQPDSVVAYGGNGQDKVNVSRSGGQVTIAGLPARTRVIGAEPALDDVSVDTLDGDDLITAAVGRGRVRADTGAGVDEVIFNGTAAADTIDTYPNGAGVNVARVLDEPLALYSTEYLEVRGLAGDDRLNAGNLGARTNLTLNGEDGLDELYGGAGREVLIGGLGNDLVSSGPGDDSVLLSDGDDSANWYPGDGDDYVDGGPGTDTLRFNASDFSESVTISDENGRARIDRAAGPDSVAVGSTENLDLIAYGGHARVTVNDLAGTVVDTVSADLGSTTGEPDAYGDEVYVYGTAAPDTVQLSRSGSEVLASGLPAKVRIRNTSAPLDALRLYTLGGDDNLITAPGVDDALQVFFEPGLDG